MLKRFRVLCGDDLPDEPIPVSFVPTSLDAMLLPPANFVDTPPLVSELGQPVSFVPVAPGVVDTGTPVVTNPTTDAGAPQPVPAGSIPGAGFPGTPIVTPVTNTPVDTSPVPEPGSLLLLATGMVATAPLLKRRFRRDPAA